MPTATKKRIFMPVLLPALLLTAVFGSVANAADGKADFRKIFLAMPEYAAAKQQLDKMVRQKAAEYNRLTENAKDEQTKQQLRQEYETWREQTSVEIIAPIVNKAKQTINQVAAEKKLDRVYDSQSSEAANAATDITADVTARLAQDGLQHTADGAKQPPKLQPVQTAQAKTEPAAENKPEKAETPAKAAAQQPKLQPAKAETTQPKAQRAPASGGAIVIQFGADTTPDEMRQWVAKAKKNGITTAYVGEKVNSKGRKWWVARATANNKEEADAICAKLGAIGLRYFITKQQK